MSSEVLDLCKLTPSDVSIDIVNVAISGGRSLSGVEQMINYTGGGYVSVAYGGIFLRSRDQHLYWNKLATILNGSVDFILVPLWTDATSPPEADSAATVSGALATTTPTMVKTTKPEEGQWFSCAHGGGIGLRAYRILKVSPLSAGAWPLEIRPPLRRASTDVVASFWRPQLRMRLPPGQSMPWHWQAPGVFATDASLTLIEAF